MVGVFGYTFNPMLESDMRTLKVKVHGGHMNIRNLRMTLEALDARRT